ncbi:hypothetical protein FOH10_16625 [Nocardia otitidiscaviarum]|uniref:Uncharacterized protein n=1 Tax=Nocardia otitidiscaviarum TaxID=1823 RepID=A0A516NMI3_9NOCA|nr:DUF6300 family protein [Nocardia otitidiscaviarum]MCP9624987.1 DUF6300 family protein [Nocardia otitidiscaviarum]QDP80095.1 hypothetical protein FOH10_16625 [Nocardia otitidiscaviarum]
MIETGDGRVSDSPGLECEFLLVEDLPCHRCGDSLICAVRTRSSFLREDGLEVRGFRTVGLCSNCDRLNPAARAVIDYVAGRGGMTDSSLLEFATVLSDWLSEVVPSRIDEAQLAVFREGGPASA